jgi:hypothetical protein
VKLEPKEEYSDASEDWHDLTCGDAGVDIWAKSHPGEWSLIITTAISGLLPPIENLGGSG